MIFTASVLEMALLMLQALKLPVFNLQEAASKISDAVRQGSHAGVSGAARSLFSEPKLLSTLLATGLSSVVLAPIVVHQVTESVPNSDAKEMMSITRDLHSQVSDLTWCSLATGSGQLGPG